MMHFIYDIILFLAYLVYLPVYALRGRVNRQMLTRLGWLPPDFFKGLADQDVVWIHAVSVGEARAAESLIRLIRQAYPKKRILVSTVTPTGREIVARTLKGDEVVFYAPLDISHIVKKFVKLIRPSALIILETEIWPNLIRRAKASGAQVAIVNGRISDKSFGHYQRFRWFLRPTLDAVDLFSMQTPEAADKIISLGAWHKKVHATGNIKFDISSDLKEPAFVAPLRSALSGRLLWIAGSTHENEEEMVLGIYRSLRKDFHNLRLLIAPRHLERVDKIRRLIRLQGLDSALLSQTSSPPESAVMMLDTIGDLNAAYRLCDIAFIGGSLVKKGGHNPIEPALFGKPILFGKHMFNFSEIRDIFVQANAAIEVEGPEALEFEMRKLLASAPDRSALGERARALVEKNRGAAVRTFGLLKQILK